MNSPLLKRFIKREFALAILATALALAFLLTIVINHFVGLTRQTHAATANIAATPQNVTPPTDYLQISTWHLLGQSDALSNASNPETATTRLDLKLRGIFYLGSQRQAYAIIETADQTQKSYQINDSLPSGEILQAIENDRIVILVNNQETTLPLSKIEATSDTDETPPQ